MRFRRRAEEAPAGAASGPADARAHVAFAGVLDGRRLWVAIQARPGTLGLRPAGGDAPLDLVDDDPHDQPGYLSARLDLTALPERAAAYDVVLVDQGRATTLVTDPLDAHRAPVAPGGRVRHRLERSDDGGLRLHTEVLTPAVELVSATAGPDGLRLEVAGPDGSLVLGADDVLGALDGPGPARVLVGPERLPVRRRDDDLVEPGRAAPLPAAGPLRLRWSGDGLLQARVTDDA